MKWMSATDVELANLISEQLWYLHSTAKCANFTPY